MVGFSDLSDNTDSPSSAIDEIISQAKDSILLQQISAINCSSFTHSLLPTDLESRFQKLKSFPANHTPPPPYYHPTPNSTSTLPPNNPINGDPLSFNLSPSKSNPIKNPDSGSLSKPIQKPKQGGSLSPSASSSSEGSSNSSLFMPTKREKEKLSKSLSPNPSPPRRKWGCFWCSPKKKNSGKENVLGWEFDSTDDELLSGLGSLSMKQQQKVIKKAMKEEEKISREAEKIVEWAKQVSARINISDIEDELSDNN